jgi:3-hydroxyisobutyrate dehydrogenase-like beta-hydroxyacid dehydrogenase
MATPLGFIGLGLMGTPIATHLLDGGYPLTVFDVRDAAVEPLLARGAQRADSPRAVAEASEVVLTSLPGPREVEAVALGPDGIIAGLRPDGVYIDLTTNAPTTIRDIEHQFRARGCHVLDAPVGGRSPLAWEGELQVMVGGDPAVFERCRPILETIGNRLTYCGASGSGMVCKLMHNDINAIFRQAVAECFTVGVKAGVDAEVLWEVVRNGITGGGSEINRTMRGTWLAGEFDKGTGYLDMHYKDTVLAAELGHELDVPMAQTELTLRRLREAMDRGWGRREGTASLLIQEELAGVEVRIAAAGGE